MKIGDLVIFSDTKTGKLLKILKKGENPYTTVNAEYFDRSWPNPLSEEGEEFIKTMMKKEKSYLVMYFERPEVEGAGPGYYNYHTQLYWVECVKLAQFFFPYRD